MLLLPWTSGGRSTPLFYPYFPDPNMSAMPLLPQALASKDKEASTLQRDLQKHQQVVEECQRRLQVHTGRAHRAGCTWPWGSHTVFAWRSAFRSTIYRGCALCSANPVPEWRFVIPAPQLLQTLY